MIGSAEEGRHVVKSEDIRCKSCGICVEMCPKKCLAISEKINVKGYKIAAITDQDRCVSCGICNTVCPEAAIAVYKQA